jgi:hypothetical protein
VNYRFSYKTVNLLTICAIVIASSRNLLCEVSCIIGNASLIASDDVRNYESGIESEFGPFKNYHPYIHVEELKKTTKHMKMAVFWVVAPCRLVLFYRSFRGLYCLHHQGDE